MIWMCKDCVHSGTKLLRDDREGIIQGKLNIIEKHLNDQTVPIDIQKQIDDKIHKKFYKQEKNIQAKMNAIIANQDEMAEQIKS